MVDVGAELAGAFVDRCSRRGLTPDRSLRLLEHRPASSSTTVDEETLGALHERLVSTTERRDRGAWYTPAWLAEQMVAQSITAEGRVADPACGGGVFLLAAAERLLALGVAPSTIVGELLWGADVDPLAIAVCEAELWSWSAAHGVPTVAGDQLVVGDPLVGVAIPEVDVVVGNPPFLGQLKSVTSIDGDRRRALTERWGGAVRPYTDVSWLFLLAAVEAVAPGGVVSLVLPQSVLGSRDGAAIRARVDDVATLTDCWVDDGTTFAAAVHVCAPRFHVDPSTAHGPNRWLAPLGAASGIPAVNLDHATELLGHRGTVIAGFRDEYYGLVDAVHEGGDGLRLVTSGAIDPFRRRAEPVRFAKRRWDEPSIDATLATGRAARWIDAQRGPKILIASQTRVIEAVVDEDGSLLAGVPAVVVRPHDVAELWLLATALHAPVVSAWMLHRTIGTGLSPDTCRPTADLVAGLPLPVDRVAWERAAEVGRAIAAGEDAWEAFAVLADASYGVDDPDLRNWWLGRIPLR